MLKTIATDFAEAMALADARRPVYRSPRAHAREYQPGLGPHSETATVRLVTDQMRESHPDRYTTLTTEQPYISGGRCDLALGEGRPWKIAIEAKLLRFLGDNGKPNDNILMHLLSPYREHRSALTDCEKLLEPGFAKAAGVLVFGYEADGWSFDPALHAFELLARDRVKIERVADLRTPPLVHPIHRDGRIVMWSITPPA